MKDAVAHNNIIEEQTNKTFSHKADLTRKSVEKMTHL